MQAVKKLASKIKQASTKVKQAPHRSFKKTTPVKRTSQLGSGVKQAWRLIVDSLFLLLHNKKIFGWLIVFFAVLTYVFVGGISQADYAALKDNSTNYVDGLDAITRALAYFGAALTGGLSEAPNEIQQFLTATITLLFWLVTIWAARMLLAGKRVKLRDAFYSGPTPIISTLVVLVVIALQLIPAGLGLYGFTIGFTEGWITNLGAGLAFGAAVILLCILSLYWITSSLIATAIVALPGMYPIHALREARVLVTGKRWDIAMRVLAVLVVQFLVWALILVPIFMLDSWLRVDWLPLVPVFVQIMSGLSIVFTSIYVYKLYRSLL